MDYPYPVITQNRKRRSDFVMPNDDKIGEGGISGQSNAMVMENMLEQGHRSGFLEKTTGGNLCRAGQMSLSAEFRSRNPSGVASKITPWDNGSFSAPAELVRICMSMRTSRNGNFGSCIRNGAGPKQCLKKYLPPLFKCIGTK